MSSPRERLATAVRGDFASSSWSKRLALVGVVVWLAYEWGPGNETVTPWLVFWTIGRSDGLAAVTAAAVVGFLFTAVQQTLSGLTSLLGFSSFERTAGAAWGRLSKDGAKRPPRWSTMSMFARAAVVFTLGTTAVVLIEIVGSGRAHPRQHLRTVVQSALLCAALVGVLGACVGLFVFLGEQVPALEAPSRLLLRVFGNPLFWLGIAGISALLGRKSNERETDDSSGSSQPA